jgi:hypothetical protein
MSKKEYILAVLHKVSGIRWPADNIRQLLEDDRLTDTYIDYLYGECVEAVDDALDVDKWTQQQIILDKLKFIKDAEIIEKKADEEDIENLEKLIANI